MWRVGDRRSKTWCFRFKILEVVTNGQCWSNCRKFILWRAPEKIKYFCTCVPFKSDVLVFLKAYVSGLKATKETEMLFNF